MHWQMIRVIGNRQIERSTKGQEEEEKEDENRNTNRAIM